jgi:glutamine amidotransferase
MKVGIIDYGVGNLGSIFRTVEQLRVTPSLAQHPSELKGIDYLILPGVGNFTDCMKILTERGWKDAIRDEVLTRSRPILGICLGMQLLADYGTEGAEDKSVGTSGLGLIPGHVTSLASLGCSLRVPHVGWNEITVTESNQHLFNSIESGTDFYFVHSFAFVPKQRESVLAYTTYDTQIVAAIGKDNVWGTQFHPEKSSFAGRKLLSNFLRLHQC